MINKNLLDQLLRSGTEMLQQKGQGGTPANPKMDLSSLLGGKGSAALAGGALGLLIGHKSGRKIGGKVLTYGGLAMLGTLAYKAYQGYQQQSQEANKSPIKPLNELPPGESEKHCKVLLISLIAASKADGHIDDRERSLIDSEVAKLTSDPGLQEWFKAELKKELDPAEVAKHATSKDMAAEMYLASLLAIDQQNFMEKSYLDELGRQLNLPLDLQAELKKQVEIAKANS
jgi:uncharacterized membrane protein YebE (DUF533 family)